MLVLHDSVTLKHRTVELLGARLQDALESPERLESILRSLELSKHEVRQIDVDLDNTGTIPPDDLSEILNSSHEPGYLRHLSTVHDKWVSAGSISQHESILPECFSFPTRSGTSKGPPKDMFAQVGYYSFDMSTGIMSETYKAVIGSANLAFQGVQILLKSESEGNPTPSPNLQTVRDVFTLCRPPGHHCDTRRAGGYCYINNAVVAAQTIIQTSHHARIGILDIDFHHGNGTQEFFYDNPQVMYVSIHGKDEFPYYTGSEEEIGTGDGIGFNANYPLETGSSVEAYVEKLDQGLRRLVDYRTQFLIISLGFDTFCLDPLGNFKIDTDDYSHIARRVRSILKDVPALILLEGGYVVNKLGENVLAFLSGWESATKT